MGFFGFLGSFMGDFVGDGGSFFPQELLCPLLAFALTLTVLLVVRGVSIFSRRSSEFLNQND